MSRSRLIQIAAIIVVIATAFVILFLAKREPFGAKNSVFHVKEAPTKVTKIEMYDDDSKLELTRLSDGWYVNGNRKARVAAIDLLLESLGGLSIKSPVSDEAFNRLINDENTRHIRVEIYSGKRLIRSFQVYRNSEGGFPTVMRKADNAEPFILNIPGSDIDLAFLFIADKEYWYPNSAFEIRPDKIKKLAVSYFQTPDSSFTIINDNGIFEFRNAVYIEEAIDTMALQRYLSYYAFIPIENRAFDMKSSVKDSIVSTTPYCRISLFSRDNDTVVLTTWKRLVKKGNTYTEDTDRLWGSMNISNKLMILRYYDIDPVIKYPYYFISD